MTHPTFRLFRNVVQALALRRPNYLRSILGGPADWSTRTCPPTELQIAHHWPAAAHALAQIVIPGVDWRPEALDAIPGADLLLRRSRNFAYPDNANAPLAPSPEAWFFINGICTDEGVAMLNAQYLHQLFQRPLTVLYNATCGAIPDLVECAFGKGWNTVTEAAASAFPAVYAALRDPNISRVVLIGHSQGTILSAVILELLRELMAPQQPSTAPAIPEAKVAHCLLSAPEQAPSAMPQHDLDVDVGEAVAKLFDWRRGSLLRLRQLSLPQLRKLELYPLANCASQMQPLVAATKGKTAVPYIESFGNENDIVARLGVLAPQQGAGAAHISGARYIRRGGWGHLLNAHYLWPMYLQATGLAPHSDKGFVPMPGTDAAMPRLYGYLNGKGAKTT